MASSSLITFEVNDIAPNKGEYSFDIITPEREYHPNPADAPMLSIKVRSVNTEDKPPKIREPIIVKRL